MSDARAVAIVDGYDPAAVDGSFVGFRAARLRDIVVGTPWSVRSRVVR